MGKENKDEINKDEIKNAMIFMQRDEIKRSEIQVFNKTMVYLNSLIQEDKKE